VNGELSPEAQTAADRAFEPFADVQRLSQTVEAFQEGKHHLFYSAVRAAFIPRYVSDRQRTTGDDVRSAAESLVVEFARAVGALNEWWRNGGEGMLVFPESRRVETAFKSVHMWLRAYQDAVCGVLLATRGDRVGRHTSMGDRIKPGKPIGRYLEEHLPDYSDWFNEWRDRRNEMKVGATFDLKVEGNPPRIEGLSFTYPPGRSASTVTEGFISLNDVIVGLDMSRRLTDVVRTAVETRMADG
jgi:hypothetical protein